MASVFLSYAREDSDKARAIAFALEKAGHAVWWDNRIEGGAEYGREIEQALEQSDAVVVLWSRTSVESAWVRDEAAAGRDRGRLVPIRLDETNPPMGFRQFQTIDLIGWTGRGDPPQLERIQTAIARIAGSRSASLGARNAPSQGKTSSPALARPILIAALVLAGAAALFTWQPWSLNRLPFVSVEPVDQSGSAKILASDLLIKLGSLQSAEADVLRLVEPGSDAKPDFTFKVGAMPATDVAQANLVLVDADGGLLWSREYTQPGGNLADLRQQVAYSAGQVLRCATEALSPGHPKLDPSVLSLYLKGCAELSTAADTRMAIEAFRTVTERAPKFAGGWGKLLIAEMEAFMATSANDLQLKEELRRHAEAAREVDPDLAEFYLVQSWLQEPRPILGWMRYADEALEKKPNNARILENHATGLGHIGQIRKATEEVRRASAIEPLSAGARQALIAFLADSGDIRGAQRELSEAERLWPGASSILLARYWFEYAYGDPKKALAIIESGRLNFIPSPAQTSFLRARADSSSANITKAIAEARKTYEQNGSPTQLIQTLGAFGRKDEAIEVLLSANPELSHGIISAFFRRPSLKEILRDPRFMMVAKRYGLIDYWQATGRWPDYCQVPDLSYDCKREAAKLRN